MLDVIKVQRPEEWQAFFQVPRLIYRHDPLWTPLPEESQRQMFDPQLNPLLRHVHLELFVALADDQPVGRIAAITDDLLPDKHIGFFGCFEAVDDPEVAGALLKAAAGSLAGRGKRVMQGPVTLNTTQQVGLLVEGFDLPPQVMMPYNPSYYVKLIEEAGFTKVLDLYAYLWRPELTGQRARLTAVARRAARIPGIRVRPINLNDPVGEGKRLSAIHNLAMTAQWGFVPMDVAEAAYNLAGLRSFADPELLTFCEVKGEPVGVCLIMPDTGPWLRAARRSGGARWLPFFIRPKSVRVGVLAVVPEYRRRGVVALLIDKAMTTLIRKGYRQAELSLIMDRNDQMNSIITSATGGKVHKVFRIYEHTTVTGRSRHRPGWKNM